MDRLKDKTAIVTGAARGIGRSISQLFANEGAKVLAIDISEIAYIKDGVEGYKLDLCSDIDIAKFKDYVLNKYGNIGQSNYAASKAGIIGLTKTWAKEFSRKGEDIRVNAIAPGYCNTEMMSTVPDKVLDDIREKIMLKRLGNPIEIANAELFLASSESSYITGQLLSVNGGLRL